jgi:hypothetical protein
VFPLLLRTVEGERRFLGVVSCRSGCLLRAVCNLWRGNRDGCKRSQSPIAAFHIGVYPYKSDGSACAPRFPDPIGDATPLELEVYDAERVEFRLDLAYRAAVSTL